MADFHQNGNITTLHNLSKRPVEEMEAELVRFSHQRPMALILPSLACAGPLADALDTDDANLFVVQIDPSARIGDTRSLELVVGWRRVVGAE